MPRSNLGALPTVPGTTLPISGSPPPPSPQPSTNPLFIQAQQGDPRATPTPHAAGIHQRARAVHRPGLRHRHRSESAEHRPGGHSALPDGSVLVSGGPARNQLFKFVPPAARRARRSPPSAEPIYDMALDAARQHLGHHRRRAALRTRSANRCRRRPIRRQPDAEPGDPAGHGLIYVSSGNGIEIFNPATDTFSHFSDIRVGSLAFDNQGTLWAATWPHNQNADHSSSRAMPLTTQADVHLHERCRFDRLRPTRHQARRPPVRLAYRSRPARRPAPS